MSIATSVRRGSTRETHEDDVAARRGRKSRARSAEQFFQPGEREREEGRALARRNAAHGAAGRRRRVDGGTGERTGRGLQGGRRRGHAKVSTAHATRRKAKSEEGDPPMPGM